MKEDVHMVCFVITAESNVKSDVTARPTTASRGRRLSTGFSEVAFWVEPMIHVSDLR
jgi:hypothetical protein